MNGKRIVSLSLLGQYINYVTEHAAECGVPVVFLGESSRYGLACVLVSHCQVSISFLLLHFSQVDIQ